MYRDLRQAVRMLLHAKGWTAVVVVSLALGIGANTALFSAVNGMLLKKLPVEDPDTLVRLRYAGRNQMSMGSSDYGFSGTDAAGQNMRATFSYPMFQQFLASNQTMSEMVACAPFGRVNVVVDGNAEIANSFITSGNFYRMLGVRASLGRTILPEDDQPTAPPVVIVSDKYWRSRFGGNPNVVGRTVQINNAPVTIVGVIAPEFTGVQQAVATPPDVWIPLAIDSQINPDVPRLGVATYWWLQVLGRLKPGVTPEQVQGNLAGVFQHTARGGLDSYLASLTEAQRSMASNRNRTAVPELRVDSGSRGVYNVNTSELRAVGILTGVVALVLLIVCANVANLLLSRATARQKEISVRLSMGATRGRLIRQLLTESLLLAFLGGGFGVLIGHWGKQLLPGQAGQATPLDWRVLLFVMGLTAITGIVFGIAPAFRATGMNVAGVLKETSRSVAGSRSVLSKALLVVQVSISLVLLIGAGLFLRTLENLRSVDVGFNPHNLVLFRINPQLNRYDEKRIALLYQEMTDRLRTVAGVRDVALSNPALLSGSVNSTGIFVQGRTYAVGQSDGVNRLVVSPNFFQMMGIPLKLGRGFTESENTSTAPKVVVVNDAAAKKYFPNENPIGRRFGTSLEMSGQMEIVGVLADAKYNSVREPAPPTMYVPHLQTRTLAPVFAVRTAGDPLATVSSIRETVRKIDPNVPVVDVFTQIEQVERRFLQEKVFAQAYALFGALALVLASVGLFGLMSYSVARRTNEMGIRMALGAERVEVVRLVMSESMFLVAVGVAIGVAMAVAASRLVASLLFGVAPTDVATMMLAMGVLIVVAAIAGYLPARRASRVDPMVALHYE